MTSHHRTVHMVHFQALSCNGFEYEVVVEIMGGGYKVLVA